MGGWHMHNPPACAATQVDGSFWHDWGFLRAAYMHSDRACGGAEDTQPCMPKAVDALIAAAVRTLV